MRAARRRRRRLDGRRGPKALRAASETDLRDGRSSLIYSMTVGRIHLGALGALHMQLSLQALAAEAHVPLPKTGLQFAEDFETETLPSVALELQGVATASSVGTELA